MAGRMLRVHRSGALLCLAAAACFGALGIFGKLAYDEGATAGTLLAARFIIAAALFWAILLPRGAGRDLRALPRRDLGMALALGAVGYAAQAGTFFAGLERLDVSLLSLILYTYPALVAVAAIAIGRERADPVRLGAIAMASAGLALVLLSAGPGDLDAIGVVLGLTAATIYTTYILVSEPVAGRMRPPLLAALVCTGAAVTVTAGAALVGQLRPGDVTAAGWGWLAGLAVVSTVGAIVLFFAGLSRVGPTRAAILSTAEPVVTVALAFAVFGERLAPAQLAGAALVIGAVVVVSRGRRPRVAVAEDRVAVAAAHGPA